MGIKAINLESTRRYLGQELLLRALLFGQPAEAACGARLSGATAFSQGHRPAEGEGCRLGADTCPPSRGWFLCPPELLCVGTRLQVTRSLRTNPAGTWPAKRCERGGGEGWLLWGRTHSPRGAAPRPSSTAPVLPHHPRHSAGWRVPFRCPQPPTALRGLS